MIVQKTSVFPASRDVVFQKLQRLETLQTITKPYCIVGDRHPIAQEYELVRKENGLLVSVRKQASGIREED